MTVSEEGASSFHLFLSLTFAQSLYWSKGFFKFFLDFGGGVLMNLRFTYLVILTALLVVGRGFVRYVTF